MCEVALERPGYWRTGVSLALPSTAFPRTLGGAVSGWFATFFFFFFSFFPLFSLDKIARSLRFLAPCGALCWAFWRLAGVLWGPFAGSGLASGNGGSFFLCVLWSGVVFWLS